ncbi:hypothetical protein RIF29_14513 [Crotalaria pallida]|uniref:Uncharacterized protein n=1 Tax=Crotalaria pallida TaxID=3830 RepID=A0AAN9FHT0_CROPI
MERVLATRQLMLPVVYLCEGINLSGNHMLFWLKNEWLDPTCFCSPQLTLLRFDTILGRLINDNEGFSNLKISEKMVGVLVDAGGTVDDLGWGLLQP